MRFIVFLCAVLISLNAAANPGDSAYFKKRFNELVFVSTHNAFNYKKGKTRFIWPNQRYPVKRQLQDGVRNLMLDVYDINGKTYLYHASPKLGKELLQPVLADIKQFLDSNKTEVVSIIYQNDIPNQSIANELKTAGLELYCLGKDTLKDWPIVGEMVKTNKRLVVFVESNKGDKFPHILSAWGCIVDTPWNTKTVGEMDCRVGRGKKSHGLFLMNNWISKGKPTKRKARKVNNEQFLLDRLKRIKTEFGRLPNFIGVNFYDQGDVIKVVKMLNEGYLN